MLHSLIHRNVALSGSLDAHTPSSQKRSSRQSMPSNLPEKHAPPEMNHKSPNPGIIQYPHRPLVDVIELPNHQSGATQRSPRPNIQALNNGDSQ